MSHSLISIILIVFCFLSCSQKDLPSPPITETTEKPEEKLEGTTYSQEQIDDIIRGMQPEKILISDTVALLNNIACTHSRNWNETKITSDSIALWKASAYKLSNEVQHLLKVVYCLGMLNETNKYSSYILLSDMESHTTERAVLVTIARANGEVNTIELAYLYGNELGSKHVQAEIISNNTIDITTTHNYNYIHGEGEVDSVNTSTKRISIYTNGGISSKELFN